MHTAYLSYHVEPFAGRSWVAFDLALDLMQGGVVDVGWLVTHKFRLEEYGRAFAWLNRRGTSQVLKTVFAFGDEAQPQEYEEDRPVSS